MDVPVMRKPDGVYLEFQSDADGNQKVADAAVLAKLSADPATQTTLAAILAAQTGKTAPISGGAAVNVTNDSKTLVAANAARRNLTIQNLSTTAMLTIALATPAVSGAGYNLAPAPDVTHPGGSITITDYTGAVYAIMSGADATVGNVSYVET